MLTVLRIVFALAAVSGLRRRTAALSAGAAVAALVFGVEPLGALRAAMRETVPLVLFLTAAIWLAAFAAQVGLAERLAAWLSGAARGSGRRLFALVCALCAVLTATVSLDGAVVLMVPLLLVLTRTARALFRPLLLATVAVANAFSLAVPQGNPTNLAVSERVGLPPSGLVAHLFAPALLATVLGVGALAYTERRALKTQHRLEERASTALSAAEKLAVGALATAAATGAAAPWLGIPPWSVLCAVGALAVAGAWLLHEPVPRPAVPWRVSVQIAALVVVFDPLARAVHVRSFGSLEALVAVALAAAACAGAANNLPASIVVGSALGSRGLVPYAALAGLSVGALVTPHGSVATLIAFDRAGCRAELHTWRYLRLWLPVATGSTLAAVIVLWLLGLGG
jgi:arsenical pump membrane protein